MHNARTAAHSGLEESLGARVYSDIMDLIELAGPTRRQNESHEVFGVPRGCHGRLNGNGSSCYSCTHILLTKCAFQCALALAPT
jgi:hypothetical protein